jgi:hypothetical protein
MTHDDLDVYRALDERGESTVHLVAALWCERALGVEQIGERLASRGLYSSGRLLATSVEIMQDRVTALVPLDGGWARRERGDPARHLTPPSSLL